MILYLSRKSAMIILFGVFLCFTKSIDDIPDNIYRLLNETFNRQIDSNSSKGYL
jgi:hypothetical protein